MSLLPGYKVNKDYLAKGGNGTVFTGVRNKDKTPVAIKKIKRMGLGNNDFDDIPLELEILDMVQEVPGVIKLLDYFCLEDGHYIVLELGPMDLFEWINRRKSVDEETALYILGQVIKIICDCWNLGIAHGDVKDENILIDPITLEIKLIDFGEAFIIEDEERKNSKGHKVLRDIHGTRDYAPPEWFLTHEVALEPLTIWTLGTLLYSLLCGQPPYEKKEDITTKEPKWEIINKCDPNTQDIVKGCLTPDPAQRMTMPQLLQNPWFRS